MLQLQPEERETHLNMVGDDHSTWVVFSDDPYWIRRFEKLGIAPTAQTGSGYEYTLTADQVLIRKGKRHVSDETRTAMRERFRIPSTTKDFAG